MKIHAPELIVPMLALTLVAGCAAQEAGSEYKPHPAYTISNPDGLTAFDPSIAALELHRPESELMPTDGVRSHLGAVARMVVTLDNGQGRYTWDGTATAFQRAQNPVTDALVSGYVTSASAMLPLDSAPDSLASRCGTATLAQPAGASVWTGSAPRMTEDRTGTNLGYLGGPTPPSKAVTIAGTYAAHPGEVLWAASYPTSAGTVPKPEATPPLGVTSLVFAGLIESQWGRPENEDLPPHRVNNGYFIVQGAETVEGTETPQAIAGEPGAPILMGSGELGYTAIGGVRFVPVGSLELIANRPITLDGQRLRRGTPIPVVEATFVQGNPLAALVATSGSPKPC